MDSIDILKVKFNSIVECIRQYTDEPTITVIIDNLIQALCNNNYEVIHYTCVEIDKWYNKNIDSILNNDFVYNKDVHQDNVAKIRDIMAELVVNKKGYLDLFSKQINPKDLNGIAELGGTSIKNHLDKIDDLFKSCKSFEENISSSMILNLNDGIHVSESIDKNGAAWRMFVNDVNTFLKLYPHEKWKVSFQSLTSKAVIDAECIEDIKVLLNMIKNELYLLQEQERKDLQANFGKTKLEQLVNEIPEIKSRFQVRGGNGIPKVNIIHGNPMFEKWKSALHFELLQLPQDDFIGNIKKLIASFNGWNDERVFEELTANVQTLSKNINQYKSKSYGVTNLVLNKKIFIVHGRNATVRNDLELLLRRIGLEPVILAEQANEGMTIIEKIEKYSDVAFAIVLYTACDEGRLKGEPKLNNRARQNVVFEHGYMTAHLGRNRVIALSDSDVEIPGDLSGIVYISFGSVDWKKQLMKDLKAGGLDLEWDKA